ncbi:hypothetical protein ACFSC6_04460 [Rufibacter sediminis]|uniref:DUF4595 domain-containing protein n=1 Tax=Rufibacter sediminis TaxID=2762756 RepID=A0ABR6VS90_9BACT|nr:hypothetical protein [Rufibacter sediminis]MBC3540025.1 hypothetical protein [Rufibacter sediminis]
MKNVIPFLLFLLLSFAAISCSDDKEEEEVVPLPEKLQLSKLTVTSTERPGYPLTVTFDYHGELLKFYKETDTNGKVMVNALLDYDDLARLSQMASLIDSYQNPSPSTIADKRQNITYDASGRLSLIILTEKWAGDVANYHYTLNYHFSYDNQGRISSIRESMPPSLGIQSDHVFDYDAKGNVIRYRIHVINSGVKEPAVIDMAITYDDKKNPFYKLGSILAPYGLPHPYLNSFIYHLSPNNPVSIKYTQTLYTSTLEFTLSYSYNKSGYPTEIYFDDTTHKLEYLEQQ